MDECRDAWQPMRFAAASLSAKWSLVSDFANNLVLSGFARAMTGIGNGALVPNSK